MKHITVSSIKDNICVYDLKEEYKDGWHQIDDKKIHYVNRLIHKEDGPATITPFCKIWAQYGVRHRIDGPAIEWLDNGPKYWSYEGVEVFCRTNEEFLAWVKFKAFM